MDATTRWETEAIRSSTRRRSGPPRPTAKRVRVDRRSGHWLTLKDAEAATGIPVNTLRKWVRKDTVESYLESDGELALRMINLDSVKERAKELGRELRPAEEAGQQTADIGPKAAESEPASDSEDREPEVPEGTMLVPIDAWNKMLNQLGNLHEAGQMLADARERAAKAETEASFLRERLAEIRQDRASETATPPPPFAETTAPPHEDVVDDEATEEPPPTTTYWRYLTTGWRDRKRRLR